MANKTERHWVEELFPPRFGLSLDDVLNEELPRDEETEADLPSTRGLSAGPDSVFAKFVRRVSPLDVNSIKNVYERVWLMMQIKAEEERKRKATDGTELESSIGGRKYKNASTSTEDLDDFSHPDIHDPCIWNSEEISVLRSAFQATKAENNKLRGELKEVKEQFAELQKKYNRERKENENPINQLKEARKANERLSILAKNLKAQVESGIRQNDLLRKQLQEAKDERKSLLRENHKLRTSLDRERINRKKTELELQCHARESLREQKIREENLKMMHEEDVQYLQKTIDELSKELAAEKESHERTRRGLNHLRQHFSSLPLQDDGQQTNSLVKEDELKNWTY